MRAPTSVPIPHSTTHALVASYVTVAAPAGVLGLRKVLEVIHKDPKDKSLCSIKWCCFKAPPVTWDRDFVYLEFVTPGCVDSLGRRCAVAAVCLPSPNECMY